jgi:superfamily II DNA/RNA helicase
MTFASLGLTEPLLHTLADLGHPTPTPVQNDAIAAILAGRDVMAQAQTGSGKTAAYLLPLAQGLAHGGQPPRANTARALVLLPTRELAQQVHAALGDYGRGLGLRTLAVHGGVSLNVQMMALRPGVDVLIATPGRLLDLIGRQAVRLNEVEHLVLDEADRLLDAGFADELERILQQLPEQRQTLLFSATYPAALRHLAAARLHEPLRINIAADADIEPDIRQRAIAVDADQRTSLLYHLIRSEGWRRVLVFTSTQRGADRLARKLDRVGIAAAAFHGDLGQAAREQALEAFKACQLQVLVATDLAARGIDIAHLQVVINYDLPRSATDYTHRIGRTGRAGESGCAISLVSADSEAHFRLIEKRQGRRVEREHIAGFEPVAPAVTPDAAPAGDGGIKGRRKSKKDKLREAAAETPPAGLRIRRA